MGISELFICISELKRRHDQGGHAHSHYYIFSMFSKDQHPATQIKSRLSLLNMVIAVVNVVTMEIKSHIYHTCSLKFTRRRSRARKSIEMN